MYSQLTFKAVRVFGLLSGLWPVAAATTADDFFERRIRPVLAEQCYECHSAESKSLQGGLRVDARAGLLQGGDSGPAVVPGKPTDSLLWKALTHGSPDLAMPSKKAKLPADVLADFERWIAEGAVWPASDKSSPPVVKFDLAARKRAHPWLWEPPHRPVVPEVQDTRWPISPVDQFIRHRLEQKGFVPAPPVEDRTWLRRVQFAITGLPPSREELQEFLADPSAGARERVVNRLLASPHFGERWARHWMDLVRYAETRGHESDFPIANAWQYRD